MSPELIRILEIISAIILGMMLEYHFNKKITTIKEKVEDIIDDELGYMHQTIDEAHDKIEELKTKVQEHVEQTKTAINNLNTQVNNK